MSDGLAPVEVAALRRLLHRGAETAVGEDEAVELTAIEKAEILLDRLDDVEAGLASVEETVYLADLFADDGPTKRARKTAVVKHLVEKAEQTRTGKSHVGTETASVIAECSARQARTHLDEIAETVPGCFVKEADAPGEAKQLRIDLETFRDAGPHAEALPPREEA